MKRQNKDLLTRMEEKITPIAVPNLMRIIVIGMAIVYMLNLALPQMGIYHNLTFIRSEIFRGQIWRVLSFIFLPPNSRPIFILLALYFYWMIGESLEQFWGTARFNLYYLLGVLGAIIAGFITGFTTNTYLNLSLFLAFAVLNPEMRVMLFFILPIKIKWLGLVAAGGLVYSLIVSPWALKLALVFSILNFLLFFGGDFTDMIKHYRRRQEWKRNTKQ